MTALIISICFISIYITVFTVLVWGGTGSAAGIMTFLSLLISVMVGIIIGNLLASLDNKEE